MFELEFDLQYNILWIKKSHFSNFIEYSLQYIIHIQTWRSNWTGSELAFDFFLLVLFKFITI